MTAVQWIFLVATAPVIILGIVGVVYAFYGSWVLLLAMLGSTKAQNHWRNLP